MDWTLWHAVWVVDLCDSSETAVVSAQLLRANGHLHPSALPYSEVGSTHAPHTILYWAEFSLISLGLLGRCLLHTDWKEQNFLTCVLLYFTTWKKTPTDSLSVFIHNGGAQCHQCIREKNQSNECDHTRQPPVVVVTLAIWQLYAALVVAVTDGCRDWFHTNLNSQFREGWAQRAQSPQDEAMVSLFRRLQIKLMI